MNDFNQHLAGARLSSDADSQPNNSGIVSSSHRLGIALNLPASLRADCSRCAGLCCVVHAFYSVQGFAFDKPAHAACGHLTIENRCGIHTERSSQGFPGCIAFDCYGAGQRVTQELFAGVNWRSSRAVAAEIFSAYEACLALHRLMAMLALAQSMVSPLHRAQMRVKQSQLDALCSSQEAKSGRLDIARLQSEVLSLIRNAPVQPDLHGS